MRFINKIDPIKLLRLALGVSLFSIGYLLTMFYFQMKDLKVYKQQIEEYHTFSIQLLHFQSVFNQDNYRVQSQILNQSVVSKNRNFESISEHPFFLKVPRLIEEDATIEKKFNELKSLAKQYDLLKKYVSTHNSDVETSKFNVNVYALATAFEKFSEHVEFKIHSFNSEYKNKIDTSKTSGFLIALISLVIFVLAYVKMNEDLYDLQKRNDEIIFINETLNNAEQAAGFGSWKLNTIENKFTLSDNFYRLLGETPNAFEPSLEKVAAYIHPEDRENVLKLHQESFNSLSDTTILYRYLLKDGSIKHMLSVGKFLNNSRGELVKIGVNQDITELIKNSKALEEKNARLIAINSELESFNNIVGHDLQEPLRKIQMFISRIEGSEFINTAPETTLHYFEKIKLSAQRMQNLMKDLVDYTRTIKGDRIFEKVDLNEIMMETLEELSVIIEEKNAVITTGILPGVQGIKFQLQQLFINLISNSLKYSKPDTIPIILVKSENFDEDLVNDKLISGSDYFKITISDNGIGFEQQYADKIFMLFKRLATDLSYTGTGLGLAICKKVIASNKGFISATGKPNEGAVFSIYLPKNSVIN